jgi:hypothetical protein
MQIIYTLEILHIEYYETRWARAKGLHGSVCVKK